MDGTTAAPLTQTNPAAAPSARQFEGVLRVRFERRDGVTALADLYQKPPLRMLFPRVDDPLPLAVYTNTAGGLVGGDRATMEIEAGAGTAFSVTAQAAEKVYRSLGSETTIENRLIVRDGGWLEWLPQETILFNGARMRRRTTIELADDAAILAGEILVFGRSAFGESMTRGLVRDSWSVSRDGRLVWADRFHAADARLVEALEHPAALKGMRVAAMLLHAGPGAEARLALLRDRMQLAPAEVRCAATAVNGVLVARWLAADALSLRPSFAAAWMALRNDAQGLAPRLPSFWLH